MQSLPAILRDRSVLTKEKTAGRKSVYRMAAVCLKTFIHPKYWYAWPVLAIMLLMSRMPLFVLWALGNALGQLYSFLTTRSRRHAEVNIHLCFPELGPGEQGRLLRRYFRLHGYTLLCMSVAWFAPLSRIKKIVSVCGQQYFDRARAAGRNIILLVPHFIALDMGGMRVGSNNEFVCMYRKSRSPLVEYLLQRRTRSGAVLVDRLASLRTLTRSLREGRPFWYTPDNDMGERASVFLPFFGTPAATVTALSRFAEIANAAVIPCISRVLMNGRGFEVRFYPPFENFPTSDHVADARRLNQEIEKWVRETPDQYMWSYRRFKTRPNNEPSFYAE